MTPGGWDEPREEWRCHHQRWEDGGRSGCCKGNQHIKWSCHIGRWVSEAGVNQRCRGFSPDPGHSGQLGAREKKGSLDVALEHTNAREGGSKELWKRVTGERKEN